MEKTDLRIKKTLRSIDMALLENLKQYEFQKITVEMICSSAMINKSTFYKYYSDKYDLLDKYLERILEEFREALQTTDFILATPDTIGDQIYRQNFKKSVEVVYSRKDIYKILWNARIDRSIFNEMIGVLRDNILIKMEEDPSHSKEKVVYTQLFASLFASNAMQMFLWWFNNDNAVSQEDIRKVMDGSMRKGLFATFKDI